MRIKLTLEYDGTNYCGWQRQAGQDSIQARLEDALERIFGAPVGVNAAGRTDAGVHALGQVAAFTTPRPLPVEELWRALNALTPFDIVVRAAEQVADSFDPRRDARMRAYEYRILMRPWPSAFGYRYAWLVRDVLALAPMQQAAALFAGEHDFAPFMTLGSAVKTTVRKVFSSAWRRDGEHLIYRVEATGYLRHMVRSMVGLMVEAGRGQVAPGVVTQVLESRERARAAAPAPACGLFLVEVRYDS